MGNNVIDLKKFEVKSNQRFFFDNNIWMFLFCPIGDYNTQKQKSISGLFENILNRNSSIIINNLILSEFSNAYLRLDYNLWKEETRYTGNNFKKDYFSTQRASETREIIASTINGKILKIADRHPDSFNSINFDNIFSYYKTIDYNDAIIYDQCKNKNWILITDDGDFAQFNDITIVNP